MAATLMEIKSRLLLPKHQQAIDPNADEEELDPRTVVAHEPGGHPLDHGPHQP